MICGWEGTEQDVDRRRALSARLLRRGGAVALGQRAWSGLGARAATRARTCATS